MNTQNTTPLSPIDEAKLARYTSDTTRIKALNDQLIKENRALLDENTRLKEKLGAIAEAADNQEKAQKFLAALEAWFIC